MILADRKFYGTTVHSSESKTQFVVNWWDVDLMNWSTVFHYSIWEGTEIGVTESGSYVNFEDTRKKSAIGLSPVVGFRVFPTYAFSISAETSLNFMVYQTSIERSQFFPDPINLNNISSGGEILFNPVSHLSLNVMF